MTVADGLRKVHDMVGDPYTYTAELRDRIDKPMVTCFGMSIPMELVHAAGTHPLLPWRSNDMIELAHSRTRTNWCWITRCFLDDRMRGKLDHIDGLVTYELCLLTRVYTWTLERNVRPEFFSAIYLPREYTTSSNNLSPSPVRRRYLEMNFKWLKQDLEKWQGKEITKDALNNSINLYNKQRGLLRQLLNIVRSKPGVLKERDLTAVMQAATLMPVEEANAFLEEFVPLVQKLRAPRDGKVRVVISGHFCAPVRFDYLDLIEDAGGVVVFDDNFIGNRYCHSSQDVEVTDDPMKALADRVKAVQTEEDMPFVNFTYWKWSWPHWLLNKVKQYNAKGLIGLRQKGCPANYDWYPFIIHVFNKAGAHQLELEVEHEALDLASIKTRIGAFMETLKAAK